MSYLFCIALGLVAGIVAGIYFKLGAPIILSCIAVAVGVLVGVGRHLDGSTHTIGLVLIVIAIQVGYCIGLFLLKR